MHAWPLLTAELTHRSGKPFWGVRGNAAAPEKALQHPGAALQVKAEAASPGFSTKAHSTERLEKRSDRFFPQ